jgi:catechol 2,3-dioxygenase-like lactoylglutathione lyase family enzyme
LAAIVEMYARGLGLDVLARFADHDGFDGAILGRPGEAYHLEFTARRGHPAGRAPTEDNLLVFYVPDRAEWEERCAKMLAAGFRGVASLNPYWDVKGKTFEDLDGYRVVLQNASWGASTG